MRLTEQGPVLQITQHHVLTYLIGLVLLGVCGYMLYAGQDRTIALVCGVFGILTILLIQREQVSVDQSTRMVRIIKKRIIGSQAQDVAFDEIGSIEVHQEIEPGKRDVVRYPLCAVLKDGAVLKLATEAGKGGALLFDHSKNEQVIGTRIAQIIGVPFEMRKAPTVSEVLHTIKDTITEQINKNQDVSK